MSKQDNFYRKKLGNGLTILFEKRKMPVVSIAASVKFGSAYELAREKGISHFVEHLMFKGTKNRSQKEIAEEIEKKGGVLNAFTGEEVTSYWCKLPSKHLFSGMNITSDLILNPKFDPKEFEKEKNVIIEEIKMYHDNPIFYTNEKIKELLYKKPFGMSIVGKKEIIRNLKRQEVINLFNKNYTSDSMILSVVGNADFEEICEFAGKIYPEKKREILEYKPVKRNLQAIEKRKDLQQANFVFGFHAPSLKEKERYNYELLATHLFWGMSSVLFQEIREKRALAYSIKGNLDLGKNYGYCMIYVGTLKEKIKAIKEIILREIKNLSRFERKDFEECKEQLIGARKLEEEDSFNTMNFLMLEEIAGDSSNYYKYEENIKKVKLEEVRKISKLKNFSSFSLVPG